MAVENLFNLVKESHLSKEKEKNQSETNYLPDFLPLLLKLVQQMSVDTA